MIFRYLYNGNISGCLSTRTVLVLQDAESLAIGAYYKPSEYYVNSFNEFQKSLGKVTKKYSNILVAGDLNLPKMDWDTMTPSSNCKHQSFYKEIIDSFNDANLTQMVNLPTRENNILDLFLTTNPTLVKKIKI
jgi:exonuclease III